jgi:flagellar protein FlaJ
MEPSISSSLAAFSYRLLRGRIPRFDAFRKEYQRSGLSVLYEAYVALTIFVTALVLLVTTALSAVAHLFLFNLGPSQYFAALIALPWTISILAASLFILHPIIRLGRRRGRIDSGLVYTVGYMGVLSAGGVSIERILDRVAQVESNTAIKEQAQRFMTEIRVFGSDISTALSNLSLRSPSELFSTLLVGIANTVKTSGDLKTILTYEAKRLLTAKRDQMRKKLATLGAMAEIYVTGMVMGPIVLIVMLTILSIMGNNTFGLSPVTQMNLIVFFVLPVAATVFIIVIDGTTSEEE